MSTGFFECGQVLFFVQEAMMSRFLVMGFVTTALVSGLCYGTFSEVDSEIFFNLNPEAVQNSTVGGFGLADTDIDASWLGGDASAQTKGSAQAGIGVSSYSTGTAVDGNHVVSRTTATQKAAWKVSSETLAAGTPILIAANVVFEGELISQGADARADAEGILNFGDGQSVEYQGLAIFEFGQPALGGLDWIGDLTEGISPTRYTLYDTQMVIYEAKVGDIVDITLELFTQISVSSDPSGSATSDFLNTGSYSLQAFDPAGGADPLDVDFTIIPEPATLLFTAGAMILGYRRRS